MNKKTLYEYMEAIEQTSKQYGSIFRRIEKVDTSENTQNQVSEKVTSTILHTLKDLLIEKIGYMKISGKNFSYGINNIKKINQDEKLYFHDRDSVEDMHFIQPIPIAVLTNKKKDSVFIIKKKIKSLSDTSPEKDKLLIYAGGHIRNEDVVAGEENNFIQNVKNTLQRELKEELGINIYPDHVEPFLIYTPDDSRSAKHIAICFVITIDFANTAFRLDHREIVQKTGKSKSGRVFTIKDISSLEDKLESWTIEILKHVFNKKLGKDGKQLIVPET